MSSSVLTYSSLLVEREKGTRPPAKNLKKLKKRFTQHSSLHFCIIITHISSSATTTTLSWVCGEERLLDDDDYDDYDDYEERAKGTAETALSNPGASEEAR